MILNSKNLLLTGVALAAFSLASVAAKAADAAPPVSSSPIYVSVFGGASFLNDVKASLSNTSPYSVSTYPGYIIGAAIGEPLIANPDLLRTDPDVSVRAALQYWKDNNINSSADIGDWRRVTIKVNGNGLVGYEERVKLTNNALNALR